MRVLLDECLPRRLKHELVGHDAKTAPEMGWASKTNGELLALAVGQFDVFLTVDRNLSYQQDLSSFDIAILVLVARTNRLEDCGRSCRGFLRSLRLRSVVPRPWFDCEQMRWTSARRPGDSFVPLGSNRWISRLRRREPPLKDSRRILTGIT